MIRSLKRHHQAQHAADVTSGCRLALFATQQCL